MSDTELLDDGIDDVWRTGLAGLTPAEEADPVARVEGRLRHRQRVRVGTRGIGAAALIAVMLGVISYAGRTNHVGVTNATAPTRVVVVAGVNNTLRIGFPGRKTFGSSGPRIILPAGRVRFVVHSGGSSHHLVIDGVPGFSVSVAAPPSPGGPPSATVTVRLKPGRYLMHCTIPGHAEAGEIAWITVR